jgi:hypothetical protein
VFKEDRFEAARRLAGGFRIWGRWSGRLPGAIESGAGQQRSLLTTVTLCYTILSMRAPEMRGPGDAISHSWIGRIAGAALSLLKIRNGRQPGKCAKLGRVVPAVSGHRR